MRRFGFVIAGWLVGTIASLLAVIAIPALAPAAFFVGFTGGMLGILLGEAANVR